MSQGTLWDRVRAWFSDEAEQLTVRFLPDHRDGTRSGQEEVPEELLPALNPHASYIRVLLSEGFLATRRSWGADRFPALHGGVSIDFAGAERATFASLSRPEDQWQVPGAHFDFPITPLLPFRGGVIEIEAALYQASEQGPLGVAVNLVGSLASLMGPPLAQAAAIAGKVSTGLDTVMQATGAKPILGLHWSLVAQGGNGRIVRPGHLVVLGAPEGRLGGEPEIVDHRLRIRSGADSRLPTGVDYLVLRIEGRGERDDWRFPELETLVRQAGEALILGRAEEYESLRAAAIAKAWTSPDLVSRDARRVALLVRDELDELREFGIVPPPKRSLSDGAAARLLASDDPRLDSLSLRELLR